MPQNRHSIFFCLVCIAILLSLVSCGDDLPDAPEWCDTYGGMNSGTCDVSSSSVVRSSSSRRSSSSAGQSGSLPSSSSFSEESSSSINMNISVSSSSSVALSSSDGSGVPGKCGGVIDYNPATERCCGSNKFNYSLQFCSGGNAYDKCGGILEYDPATELCCGSNKFTTSTQFCSGGSVYDKCGGTLAYNPSTEQCCGSNKYTIATEQCCGSDKYTPATEQCCGSNKYTPATQFCYNSSKVGNFCGINPQKSYNPDLYECKSGSNGIYLKGGIAAAEKTYNAVLMGTQVWMAENLNYNAAGNKCYDDDPANCTIYGRLYNWATAMAGAASSTANPSGVRGVCPSGWHIPSNDEWNVLMKFVNPSCTDNIDCANAGTKLKTKSGWNPRVGIPVGTDDFGFSALPGGYGSSSGSFISVGNYGGWWSASELNANAYYRGVDYSYEEAIYHHCEKSYYFFSVRCVQD